MEVRFLNLGEVCASKERTSENLRKKFKLASKLIAMLYCAGASGSSPHPDGLPAVHVTSIEQPPLDNPDRTQSDQIEDQTEYI